MKESAGQHSLLFIILAVVVCIGLGFVIGFLWSVLILVLAVMLIRKVNGGPVDGYCMAHLRKKLPLALLGALFVVVGVGGAAYAWTTYNETPIEWGNMIGGVVVAFLGVVIGTYQAFTALRDACFPEKSTLAKSIRSQLDYPDEAPGVVELFSMVDSDIAQNGTWFGPLAVGKEWVLGDEASRLDRVRGIFYVAEIQRRHTANETNTSRILQLILLDDRRQMQTTDFSKADDLEGAFLFLKERLPDAFYGKKSEMERILSQTEEEWHQTQADFEKRCEQREKDRSDFTKQQNTILRRADGAVTSRITPALLRDTLDECQQSREEVFFLEATRPVLIGGKAYIELECTAGTAMGQDVCLLLKEVPQAPGNAPMQGMQTFAHREKALRLITDWLRREEMDLAQWTPVSLAVPRFQ